MFSALTRGKSATVTKEQSYHFSVEDAVKYGVDEAVFLYNIRYWIAINKEQGSNVYDERVWTYNTRKTFTEVFPFWTENQIRKIVSKLKAADILLTGRFNKKGYDRTTWYTLNDDSSKYLKTANGEKTPSMWRKAPMDVAKSTNGCGEKHQPIPDITADITADETSDTFTYTRTRDNRGNLPSGQEQLSSEDLMKGQILLEEKKLEMDRLTDEIKGTKKR